MLFRSAIGIGIDIDTMQQPSIYTSTSSMALNEWSILLIYIGAFFLWRVLFAYFYLRKKFDADGNGTIDPDEISFLKDTRDMPVVVERPNYYSMSIQTNIRTFVRSMLHSFCYGSLVVFAMNLSMAKVTEDTSYTYLIAVYMVQMACMFMCAFPTNGIHVVTNNPVHVLYYGFGFIPLAFLWSQPDHKYFIAIAALWTLAVTMVSRTIALPNYPKPKMLTKIYKLNRTTGEWKLASVPPGTNLLGIQNIDEENKDDGPPEVATDGAEAAAASSFDYLFATACAFPTYEILHVQISSSLAIGILTALVTNHVAREFGIGSNLLLAISVLAAAVVSMIEQCIGPFGCTENKMHRRVLAKFWPMTTAVLSAALGAATASSQVGPRGLSEASAATYWISVGSLIAAIGITFVQALLAKLGQQCLLDKNVG